LSSLKKLKSYVLVHINTFVPFSKAKILLFTVKTRTQIVKLEAKFCSKSCV